ncbi:hypothetical protein [Flavobacterium davisii]|uniref:hypothetical protein n=1 Tax=Flavobacterium davisii TaxID=2906077 RepID=UPI0035B148AE
MVKDKKEVSELEKVDATIETSLFSEESEEKKGSKKTNNKKTSHPDEVSEQKKEVFVKKTKTPKFSKDKKKTTETIENISDPSYPYRRSK